MRTAHGRSPSRLASTEATRSRTNCNSAALPGCAATPAGNFRKSQRTRQLVVAPARSRHSALLLDFDEAAAAVDINLDSASLGACLLARDIGRPDKTTSR